MIRQDYIQKINDAIANATDEIFKINKKSNKFEEKKNEIIKSVRSKILFIKRIYLFEGLRKLLELKLVEEQTKGLKELIDDLFITSTLGTEIIPTHFMDLYSTKDMITSEINHEVYREYGTPIFKRLENACVNLVSSKGMKDKQIDYLSAKVISCVRLQDELAHQDRNYNENPEIEFTVNTIPIEFDEDGRVIYADMLNLLISSKVLNKDRELIKLATTFEETQIATYATLFHSEFNDELQNYGLVENTIYTSHGTEFVFNEDGVCVALKLNGRTATKEDIIAESEKIERQIRQDQEKVHNSNL